MEVYHFQQKFAYHAQTGRILIPLGPNVSRRLDTVPVATGLSSVIEIASLNRLGFVASSTTTDPKAKVEKALAGFAFKPHLGVEC